MYWAETCNYLCAGGISETSCWLSPKGVACVFKAGFFCSLLKVVLEVQEGTMQMYCIKSTLCPVLLTQPWLGMFFLHSDSY